MVNVCRDEDAHEIVALAQDVVGTPAYKNAVFLFGNALDLMALQGKQDLGSR